jgi:hypothetical protein
MCKSLTCSIKTALLAYTSECRCRTLGTVRQSATVYPKRVYFSNSGKWIWNGRVLVYENLRKNILVA